VASKARAAFDENCKDIDKLLEVHKDITGSDPGRRYGVEVLNKSAIVLLTSFWEAYCEDIAAEGLQHLVTHAVATDRLPLTLRKLVAKELNQDPNEIAVWDLADGGWRKVLESRLARLQEERNRRLNTPKSAQIDELFRSALGIDKVSAIWYWNGMSAEQARSKLDKFVTLRGEIAHRGRAASGVRKIDVRAYYGHIKRLASKTGGKVAKSARLATGKNLW
jgi:RiboL-PSP-HEPN